MANNNVQIIIQAVDSASNVFKAIGSSSEGMGQSVEKAMSNATRDAQKAQAAMIGLKDTVGGAIGDFKSLAAGAGMVGIGATIVSQAKNWALSVYELRRAIGGTAEDASQLLVIGKYAGIGTEEAAGYFAKFGKAISKAKDEMRTAEAQGKTSSDMFTRLGLSLSDLDGKNSAEIFKKIAEKMRNMADGADKDRVAMELFGKSGFQVTEMMNLTAEQMDTIIKKAQDMGLILDDETTNAWKNLDRQMNAVLGTAGKMAIAIGNDMLPILQEKVTALKSMTDQYGALSPEMRKVIGLSIEASGEFAAFTIAARTLAAFMPYLSAALLSPWTAVIAAIGIAIGALYQYMDTKNKVKSYDDKAEVYEENGKLYKKQWVEGQSGLEGYGIAMTAGGYQKVELSPEEYAAHNQWKTAPKTPKLPENPTVLAPLAASGGAGSAAADKAERRLEEANRKAADLMAQLNQKIADQFGTTYEVSMAKLNAEVTKWQGEMDKMAKDGADTTGLPEKIEEYKTQYTEKIKKTWREAWTDVKNQSSLIGAQLLENKNAEADAELAITITRLNKEREEKKKHVMVDKNDKEAELAVDKEFNDKIALASKNTAKKKIDNDLSVYQKRIELNNQLVELEGKTQAQVDVLNKSQLTNEISYINTQMLKYKEDSDEYIKLAKEKYSAEQQLHAIAGRDITTAGAEAMRRIKAQTHDYAADMESTFNSMVSTVEDHFNAMLKGTESFSSGFKGIISDMVTEVQSMLVKMFVNQYITGPLQSLFGGIVGGISGGSGGGLVGKESIGSHATGGLASGWSVVGEEGPELVNFSNPGRVYTASQTANALSGNGSTPNVKVNIINNSGSQVSAKTEDVKFNGTEWVVNMWLDGVNRNVGGSRDMLSSLKGG